MRLTESYWTLFEIDINGLNCALITARRVFVEKLPSASSTRLTEALKAANSPGRGLRFKSADNSRRCPE